ncbi:Factor of DNA methylation 1 [Linum perenne]
MNKNYGELSDISESEIDDYVDELYERIRNGDHKGEAQSRVLPQRHNPSPNDEDQLVWPRMGIVVNVSMELESQVLENGYWLEKFARYKIVDVHVLLYQECLKAQVVVKFSSDWNGLAKSAEFENNFKSQHCGKEDWKGREKDDCNYHPFHGWIAHRDDYDFEGVIGEYLRKEAQLKTVSGVSQETVKSRKTETTRLTEELCESNKNLSEWQYKYHKKARNLSMKQGSCSSDFHKKMLLEPWLTGLLVIWKVWARKTGLLKRKLNLLEHLDDQNDAAVKKSMKEMDDELQEKIDSLADEESIHKALE